MKYKILLSTTILITTYSVSNAMYQVLDKSNKVVGRCNDLKIEKDDNNRFSRAVFSNCDNKEVFSFTGDFHYST